METAEGNRTAEGGYSVVSLPMRDGNYKLLQNYLFWYFVVSLPMRDGNTDEETERRARAALLLAYL